MENLYLGAMVASYNGKFPKTKLILAILGVSLLVTMLLLLAFYNTISALLVYGPAASLAWSKYWYIAGVSLAILGIIGCLHLVNNKIIDLMIFEQGIVLRKSFKRTYRYRWNEICGILYYQVEHKSSRPRKINTTKIYLKNGSKITLKDSRINNLPEITTRIKAFLYPILLRKYYSLLRTGNQLKFGPIKFNTHLLEIKQISIQGFKKIIEWKLLNRVYIHYGYLIFESSQRKTRIPVSKIPNLDLLLAIINTEFT